MTVSPRLERFFRPVIGHPHGAVVHEGDCRIYQTNVHICTCGLLHTLASMDNQDEYPSYWDDLATQERTLSYLWTCHERDVT